MTPARQNRTKSFDLVGLGTTALDDGVVHAGEREVADELGDVIGAAERAHGGCERVEQLGMGRGEIGGIPVGEARTVDRKRARRFGRLGIARLREHALDPAAQLGLGIGGRRDP